jgi:xanthine dehydrogenase molybdenum-binding subunit
MTRDDMLHGVVVLSPHARARVLRIDVSRAQVAPGVIATTGPVLSPKMRKYGAWATS